MWELLIVFLGYLLLSFAGMAALWTVAARKGHVPAPAFFFWMNRKSRTEEPRAAQPAHLGSN